MSSIWKVKIHRLVLSEDFKSISHPDQKIILRDINKKLSLDPQNYGKPLAGELKGYWRLRVGDYRVIYKVCREVVEVLVIKVGIRRNSEVYLNVFYRLEKMGKDLFS
jgi:mRNA interferase RelE/StbE